MRNVFRKEVKYVIHESRFVSIRSKLSAFMRLDPHGTGPMGEYHIRSLYLDSASDRDFKDNLDGVLEKRKIRIRVYSPDSPMALLEYKCKSGSDSRKMSIEITKEEAIRMENRHYECLLDHDEELATFLYNKITQNIYRPKTIVDYDRIAFLYPVSDVRITYDFHLQGSFSHRGLYDEHIGMQPLFPDGFGVLEVKYNDFLASPLQRIVSELDQLPEASSKYSSARLKFY